MSRNGDVSAHFSSSSLLLLFMHLPILLLFCISAEFFYKLFHLPAVTAEDFSTGSAVVLLDDHLAEFASTSTLRHLTLRS